MKTIKRPVMQKERITLEVSTDAAEAYRSATPQKQAMFTVWLKEPDDDFETATDNLDQAMQAMSQEAQKRGLNPDLLDEILNEK